VIWGRLFLYLFQAIRFRFHRRFRLVTMPIWVGFIVWLLVFTCCFRGIFTAQRVVKSASTVCSLIRALDNCFLRCNVAPAAECIEIGGSYSLTHVRIETPSRFHGCWQPANLAISALWIRLGQVVKFSSPADVTPWTPGDHRPINYGLSQDS